MSDVWVKVKLDPDLHEKFRRWVFENDTSMQKTVVGLVEGVVSKARPVERKQPVVKSQSIGGVPVGPLVERAPVTESEVPAMKCAGCGESVARWTTAKNGKPYCKDCVDNQRNGQ